MIAFLILHYKTIEETRNCIKSIKKMDGYNEAETYILVVDNASNDGTGEMLSGEVTDCNVKVLTLHKSLGFSGGNNYGYKYLREKIKPDQIVVCNNDIEFTQNDFLSRIKNVYNKEHYAICGPNVFKFENGCKVRTSPLPSPATTKKSIQKLHGLRQWRIKQIENGYCWESSMLEAAKREGIIKAIIEWYKDVPTFLWFEMSHKMAMLPIKLITYYGRLEEKLNISPKRTWGGGTTPWQLFNIFEVVYR